MIMSETMKGSALVVAGSGDYAGACKMAHLYGRSLRDAGWSVSFVTGDRPGDGSPCIADVLRNDAFEVCEETGFFRLRDSSLISRMRGHIGRINPEFLLSVVQVDVKIVAPASRACRKPYLVSDQTLHRFSGPLVLKWMKRLAFAREMRRATGIIASSAAVRQQAIKEFKCRPDRVEVVPNGIDTSAFVEQVAPANGIPPQRAGSVRILNVGRLDPQKGQEILVKAVANCLRAGIGCDLLLAGDATNNYIESVRYAEGLRRLVSDLGIAEYVHFLGWRRDIAALHRAADVFVHSALWEGFPLAPLEAMASGLPVVVTDCVGWPEGFEQRVHGMVVKAGNIDELAQAIQWIARIPAVERAPIGAKARALAQSRYDVSVTGKQFVALCERFLQKPPAAGR